MPRQTKTASTVTKSARVVSTPRQLAERLVLSAIERPGDDILCDLRETELWGKLAGPSRMNARVRMADELKASLPEALHATLAAYSDLHSENALTEAEAAFTLGRAWERRVGGAR